MKDKQRLKSLLLQLKQKQSLSNLSQLKTSEHGETEESSYCWQGPYLDGLLVLRVSSTAVHFRFASATHDFSGYIIPPQNYDTIRQVEYVLAKIKDAYLNQLAKELDANSDEYSSYTIH